MMLRIPHGNGDKARDVPLSPILLDQLRAYYRSLKRRNGWIFPSRNAARPHDPITDKTVWHACRQSAIRAGIDKPIHPHTLRHHAGSRTIPGDASLDPLSARQYWGPAS